MLVSEGAELAFSDELVVEVPEGGAWNTVGPKAEWRTPFGKADQPYALILRHTFEPEGATKAGYFAIVKLDGAASCLYSIVDVAKEGAEANAKAREAADAARTAVCPGAKGATTSSYTNTVGDACKVTVDEEIDSSESLCKGAGDYSVRIFDGDLRQRAILEGAGAELELSEQVARIVPEGAAWNTVGVKAEWRSLKDKIDEPFALILRHTFEGPQEDGVATKDTSYLAVVKVNGAASCVAAVIEATGNASANVQAREAADATRGQVCPSKIEVQR
jgi:hypothetical protein